MADTTQRHPAAEWVLAMTLAAAVMMILVVASAFTYAIDLVSLRQMVERLLETPVRVAVISPDGELHPSRPSEAAHRLEKSRELFDVDTPFTAIRPPVDTLTPAEPVPPVRQDVAPTEPPRVVRESFEAQERGLADEAPILTPPVIARLAGAAGPTLPVQDLTPIYRSGREGASGAGRPGGAAPFTPRDPEESPLRSLAAPRHAPEPFLVPQRNLMADGLALQHATVETPPEAVYPSLDREVVAEFTVYSEPTTGTRYFRLTIRVRNDAAIAVIPKDVLYLFDVSQSVRGDELRIMRDAIVRDIRTLPADNRWNCAVFSETSAFYAPDFLPAAAAAGQADAVTGFLKRRENETATNVFRMTSQMLQSLPGNPRPTTVFLVSDGVANAGAHDVSSLVSEFSRVRRDAFSILPFNAGAGGDQFLLELLAYRSRGFAESTETLADAAERFHAFTRRYARPVLTSVVANYTNLVAEEVYPQVLPDLYRDAPIVLCGRCRKGDVVSMRVAGQGVDGPREFFFRTRIPDGDATAPEIAALWAQGKANALMAELADRPDDTELRARILDLAAAYRLSSITQMLTKKSFFQRVRSAVTGQ